MVLMTCSHCFSVCLCRPTQYANSSCDSGEGAWVFHADGADSSDMLAGVESGCKASMSKTQAGFWS